MIVFAEAESPQLLGTNDAGQHGFAARGNLRMGGSHATALAPLLSADAADRTIVALDGMAPEQALALATQVEGLPSLMF